STHQAARFLIPPGYTGPLPPPAEGEWERIILELGPFGFGLVLLARTLIVRGLWISTRRQRRSDPQPLLLAALLFTLLSLPGSLVVNQTASLFYWVAAGCALIPTQLVEFNGAGWARSAGRNALATPNHCSPRVGGRSRPLSLNGLLVKSSRVGSSSFS